MKEEILGIVSKLSSVKERKIYTKTFNDILMGKISVLDLISDKKIDKEIERIKKHSTENNNLLTRVETWAKPKASDKIPEGF